MLRTRHPKLSSTAGSVPGDIGRIDADGALSLVGRIKSEINRAGIKIQAEEIDMLLERHPAVDEACAFGVPDAASGEAVAAAIVLSPGAREGTEEIRRWCRDQVRCRGCSGIALFRFRRFRAMTVEKWCAARSGTWFYRMRGGQ